MACSLFELTDLGVSPLPSRTVCYLVGKILKFRYQIRILDSKNSLCNISEANSEFYERIYALCLLAYMACLLMACLPCLPCLHCLLCFPTLIFFLACLPCLRTLQFLAKTWIYLTPYTCTERIFDSELFMYNKTFLKKLLQKLVAHKSHLYASFGAFCVQIG